MDVLRSGDKETKVGRKIQLTVEDLLLFRDMAVSFYTKLPMPLRIQGMQRDLTEEEIRDVALMHAAYMFYNRAGMIVKDGDVVLDFE